MAKAPYTLTLYVGAQMKHYPSFVKPDTVGQRVVLSTDLTVGRWYAMFTNACDKPTVIHAQYKGENPAGYHEFAVCEDDYRAMPALAYWISRRHSTIFTGLGAGGDIMHVYKFKSRKEKSMKPVSKSPYDRSSTCKKHGIKEGDKFVVVDGGNRNFKEGTIVTLIRDDGSSCPYFEVPGRQWRETCYLWRLAPVNNQNVAPPIPPKQSPYERPKTCADYGIKVGDQFEVIAAGSVFPVGTHVELYHDDKTHAPRFRRVGDTVSYGAYCNLSRLRPLVKPVKVSPIGRIIKDEMPPIPTVPKQSPQTKVLSEVDQLKSEIDALVAQKQQKQDAMAQLQTQCDGIQDAIKDAKLRMRIELTGYI